MATLSASTGPRTGSTASTCTTQWRTTRDGFGWRRRRAWSGATAAALRDRPARRTGAQRVGGDAVPGPGWGGVGRHIGQGPLAHPRRGAASLHHGRRAFERCRALDLPGPRGHAVDRHFRRRPEFVSRRPVRALHREGRAAERQRGQDHRRWRIALAGHHAGYLPGVEEPVARSSRRAGGRRWNR